MKKLLTPYENDSFQPLMQSYSFWSFEKGSHNTVTSDEVQKISLVKWSVSTPFET
jgi:hypothetical protein